MDARRLSDLVEKYRRFRAPGGAQVWRHAPRASDFLHIFRERAAVDTAAHLARLQCAAKSLGPLRTYLRGPWPHGVRLERTASLFREFRGREHERLRRVLAEARARLQEPINKLRMERASPERFNAFHVLRIERREYVHSNVLAWLLDPLQTHGLGARFLNLVLAEAGLPLCPQTDAGRVKVRREHVGDTSIMDITVSTPSAFLVIENKVDAEEGEEQTARELSDFRPRAGSRPFSAVFLNVGGELPRNTGFVAWSYGRILGLLDRIEFAPRVEQFLHDYREAVRDLEV